MSVIYKLFDLFVWSVGYYLSKLKSYRRYKGGTWVKVFPKLFGASHMEYWIKEEDILPNEAVIETEKY